MNRAARISLAMTATLLIVLPSMAREKPAQLVAGALPAWLREARERPADPYAPWTLLHQESIIEPMAEGGVRITTRFAARATSVDVLNGFRSFNVVHRPDDTIISSQGWTIHPDGVVVVPDAKDDVSDIPWIDGDAIENIRARHVQLAEVIPGSIVAWEHEVRSGLDTGARAVGFGARAAPTRLSRATLRVPDGWSVEATTNGGAFTESRSATSITLELADLRPLPPDPFPAPSSQALPHAWLRWFSPEGSRGFRDWEAVGRWYAALSKEPASQAVRLLVERGVRREVVAPAACGFEHGPGARREPGLAPEQHRSGAGRSVGVGEGGAHAVEPIGVHEIRHRVEVLGKARRQPPLDDILGRLGGGRPQACRQGGRGEGRRPRGTGEIPA